MAASGEVPKASAWVDRNPHHDRRASRGSSRSAGLFPPRRESRRSVLRPRSRNGGGAAAPAPARARSGARDRAYSGGSEPAFGGGTDEGPLEQERLRADAPGTHAVYA